VGVGAPAQSVGDTGSGDVTGSDTTISAKKKQMLATSFDIAGWKKKPNPGFSRRRYIGNPEIRVRLEETPGKTYAAVEATWLRKPPPELWTGAACCMGGAAWWG
jgi:hypothetical protein